MVPSLIIGFKFSNNDVITGFKHLENKDVIQDEKCLGRHK